MTALLVVLTVLVAAGAAVPIAAAQLVSRVRPSTMVPLLAIGSVLSSASFGAVLGLLGLAVIGRIPLVADLGGWSADALQATVPVPPAVGVAAAAMALVLITRSLRRAAQILLLLARSDRLGRRLRRGGGPIVIVDGEVPDAFTLAGIRGCVVISRELLGALEPAERRMLIGHELSHLNCRHHLYVHAVDLAAAANPFLRRAADAVRLGVERWADEDAARTTGDRRTAGTALARTALVRASLRRAAERTAGPAVPMLGAVSSHVPYRARALLAPAPRGAAMTGGFSTLVLAVIVATFACALYVHAGFEHAETARLFLAR